MYSMSLVAISSFTCKLSVRESCSYGRVGGIVNMRGGS